MILHHDDELVVVDKPSGLAVHRGWSGDEDTARTRLQESLGCSVWPLHRLDRATSGALAFALEAEASARLSKCFECGEVEKRYLVVVRGAFPPHLDLDYPLRPLHPKTGKRQRASEAEALPARTEFRRLAVVGFEGREYSLVEARPRSGRTHQIRRHLKHLSHPAVGDVRYGKGDINRVFRSKLGLHRLALHARSITLPTGMGPLEVHAPLPADLAIPLEAMGLVGPGTPGMPPI